MLFVETFFMEPFFTNWALHPFTVLFFVVILKAKITCITLNCVTHFMTAGSLTIGCGRGLYLNLNEKNQ